MTLEYGTFAVGATTFPLVAATTNPTLQDADPALNEALGYFQGLLQIHLGDRWTAEVTRLSQTWPIVASTAPYDPVPIFQQAQFALPLLAVYRLKAKFTERTINRWLRTSTWGADWIFPALTPAQMERLCPFLGAAEVMFMDRVSQGFDPAYVSGRKVWVAGGVQVIGLTSSEIMNLALRGPGTTPTNTAFQVLHLEFAVQEMSTPVTGAFEPLAGVDAHVDEASGGLVDIDFAVNNP